MASPRGKLSEHAQLKTFINSLDNIGLCRLHELETEMYKGRFEEVDFQNVVVARILETLSKDSLCLVETPPGSGKTIMEAKLAFGMPGKVLVVSSSTTALGNEFSGGIMQKFHAYAKHIGCKKTIAALNTPDCLSDILFYTPRGLHRLRKRYPEMFKHLTSRCSAFLIDEVHHFPNDPEKDLEIFDKIEAVARDEFLAHRKPVVGFTATCFRLDGKKVMGRDKSDIRVTIQDLINLGRCPEIRGIQAYIQTEIIDAHSVCDMYRLVMSEESEREYWRAIVDRMIETYKRYPLPTAAFVRMQSEARDLARLFNARSGLGAKGFVVMTADTPQTLRQEYLVKLRTGALAGYVTCQVGEEAIDVPPLAVIHLIRRTRSLARNMQALGRSTRILREDDPALPLFASWGGKKFVLVIDYQAMHERIIANCIGLAEMEQQAGGFTKQYAEGDGSPASRRPALEAQFTTFVAFQKEREWVLNCMRDANDPQYKLKRLALLAMIRLGLDRTLEPGQRRKVDLFIEEDGTPAELTVDGVTYGLRGYNLEKIT